jgi:hypothetical protein
MKTNLKIQACIIPCCLVLGSAISGAQPSLKYTLEPASEAGNLGSAIIALGDVDGDGVPDFATSDPSHKPLLQTGAVYVVSGADGSIIRELRGNEAFLQRFGFSLAAADLNDDGRKDLIIAAPGSRSVWIVSGADFSTLFQITGLPGAAGSVIRVATIDDLNNDGCPDLVIGFPALGRVDLYSGADGGFLRTISGSAFAQFGAAVAAVSDLNGDGLSDIAISAPSTTIDGISGAGRVTFHSSADGSLLGSVNGTVAAARLGVSLGAGGDLDGDGVGDLLVGSGTRGTCVVVSGATQEILADYSFAGYSVTRPIFAGGSTDFDEDEVPDWIVGYPGDGVGALEIISGESGEALLQLEADAADTGFGSAAAVIAGLGVVVAESRYVSPETRGIGRLLVYQFEDDAVAPTIVFGSIDSGVADRKDAGGTWLSDRLAAVVPAEGWRNHGHFVSQTTRLITRLLAEGVITELEAGLLRSAAARSNAGGRN